MSHIRYSYNNHANVTYSYNNPTPYRALSIGLYITLPAFRVDCRHLFVYFYLGDIFFVIRQFVLTIIYYLPSKNDIYSVGMQIAPALCTTVCTTVLFVNKRTWVHGSAPESATGK